MPRGEAYFGRRSTVSTPIILVVAVIVMTTIAVPIQFTGTANAASSSLTVYAEDEDGNRVSGASVVLYDDNWNHIGTKTTDSNGEVSWSDLEGGTYNLELYNGDAFWGGKSVHVASDNSETTTVQREEPYEEQIDLTDEGDGDGTFEIGETLTISPEVRNDQSWTQEVRIRIYVDSDDDKSADASVSRGPITISSGSTGWFGWDYTPDSSGTHNVRVEVETNISDSWVLTDDSGWVKSFDVQSNTGDLDVYVEDETGTRVAGASVILYDSNWNGIGTKTTDSNGNVKWTGLSEDTYQIELYNGEELWGGDSATVTADTTTTKTIARSEPYEQQIDLTDQGDGDGTFRVGETVTISVEAANDKSFSRDVRTHIYLDTDDDGSAEASVTKGPTTISAGWMERFQWDYDLSNTGRHEIRVEIETKVNNKWVLTDGTGWTKSFDVLSNTGDLTVTAEDQHGNHASGVTVILYDDSWNRIGSRTTNSYGGVSWSDLREGSYNLELYSDTEFWAGTATNIEAGSTTSTTIQRSEPYEQQVDLTEQGDGDGTYEVGETVSISPEVANRQSFERTVRATIFLDTDNDGSADTSVTRGPIQISGGSTGWFGWDYAIGNTGTHQVRVEVETDIDGTWVLTDVTDWTAKFDAVGNTGGLSVSATDEAGNGVSSADIVLYDSDWNHIGSKTTDSSGDVSWSELAEGTYNIELYNGDELWGGTSVSVVAGSTTSTSVTRQEPYEKQIDLTDRGDGDGTFETGETVTISPEVANDQSFSRDTRVTIYLDTDNDDTSETSVTRGPITISESSTAWYGWDYAITATETHQIRVEVETKVNGDWVLTDTTGWTKQFTPSGGEGELTVTAKDESGNLVSGARVVLYDGSWNQIGSKEPGTEGQVSWSGLSEGSYHIELYNDGEFWGGSATDVTSGSSSSVTIQRLEPVQTQIDLTEVGDGDGILEAGEVVTISPEVANEQTFDRSVRVTIYVDSDGDGTAEDSERRGPITISAGSMDRFGWDYSIGVNETHRIRVEVETSIDNEWILTDDSGWVREFDPVEGGGELQVTAEDGSGSPVPEASVVLYDDNWNRVGSKTTGSNGEVRWSGLSEGTYNLELYNDASLWGGTSVSVSSGDLETTTVRRQEPYETQVDLTDQGDGDGTIEVGEPVSISPEVRNDRSHSREVRVLMGIDTDRDSETDVSVIKGPETISKGTTQFNWQYTPKTGGDQRLRVRVEANLQNEWVLTDQTGWMQTFSVVEAREAPPSVVGGFAPTDPDDDDLYEDLNGNGRLDYNDVVLLANHLNDATVNEYVRAYDFNDNGRVGTGDYLTLFHEVDSE